MNIDHSQFLYLRSS